MNEKIEIAEINQNYQKEDLEKLDELIKEYNQLAQLYISGNFKVYTEMRNAADDLMRYVFDKKMVNLLITRLIESPEKFYFEFNSYNFIPITKNEDVYLSHCKCGMFPLERRKRVTKNIIENINSLGKEKEEQINLLSFGSGGLAQDLIIISELALHQGYKNINISFIDPLYNGMSDTRVNYNLLYFFRIINALNKELNININITFYASAKDYVEKASQELDFIWEFDMDEFTDTMEDRYQIRNTLGKKGIHCIYTGNHGYILEKDTIRDEYEYPQESSCKNTFFSNDIKNFTSCSKAMSEFIADKKSITIIINANDYICPRYWDMFLLSIINKKNLEEITIITPDRGYPTSQLLNEIKFINPCIKKIKHTEIDINTMKQNNAISVSDEETCKLYSLDSNQFEKTFETGEELEYWGIEKNDDDLQEGHCIIF